MALLIVTAEGGGIIQRIQRCTLIHLTIFKIYLVSLNQNKYQRANNDVLLF